MYAKGRLSRRSRSSIHISTLAPIALLMGSVLLLYGCASPAPELIRQAPPNNPTIAQVRDSPSQFTGNAVRWGGTIVEVRNFQADSQVEIVGRDLYGSGRPRTDTGSRGRFLARIEGFIDPAVYEQGRGLTVYGRIKGVTMQPIGDYPYRYPVVDVQTAYLWEPIPEHPVYLYDPWYDPFYSPYPWRPRYSPYYW